MEALEGFWGCGGELRMDSTEAEASEGFRSGRKGAAVTGKKGVADDSTEGSSWKDRTAAMVR